MCVFCYACPHVWNTIDLTLSFYVQESPHVHSYYWCPATRQQEQKVAILFPFQLVCLSTQA